MKSDGCYSLQSSLIPIETKGSGLCKDDQEYCICLVFLQSISEGNLKCYLSRSLGVLMTCMQIASYTLNNTIIIIINIITIYPLAPTSSCKRWIFKP